MSVEFSDDNLKTIITLISQSKIVALDKNADFFYKNLAEIRDLIMRKFNPNGSNPNSNLPKTE